MVCLLVEYIISPAVRLQPFCFHCLYSQRFNSKCWKSDVFPVKTKHSGTECSFPLQILSLSPSLSFPFPFCSPLSRLCHCSSCVLPPFQDLCLPAISLRYAQSIASFNWCWHGAGVMAGLGTSVEKRPGVLETVPCRNGTAGGQRSSSW